MKLCRYVGFSNWVRMPFNPVYLGISGIKGGFLGFWAVIMQAAFSFFGSDVPSIVGFFIILYKSVSDRRRHLEKLSTQPGYVYDVYTVMPSAGLAHLLCRMFLGHCAAFGSGCACCVLFNCEHD